MRSSGRRCRTSPDDRYGSCGEFVEAARDALGVREPLARCRLLLLAVAGAALIAAAVLAGLLLSQGGGRGQPELRADPHAQGSTPSSGSTRGRTSSWPRSGPAQGQMASQPETAPSSWRAPMHDTVSRIDPEEQRDRQAGRRSRCTEEHRARTNSGWSGALGSHQGEQKTWLRPERNSFAACALSQLDPKTLLTNYTLNPTGKDNACGPVATLGGPTWFGEATGSWRWSIRTPVRRSGRLRRDRSASPRPTVWRWARAPCGLLLRIPGAVPFRPARQAGDRDRLRLLSFGRRRRRGRCLGH